MKKKSLQHTFPTNYMQLQTIKFVQKGLARNGLSIPSKEIEKSSDGLFS